MQADKLEKLRERMIKVRELFRDTESTEFVIVTIPTVRSLESMSIYFSFCCNLVCLEYTLIDISLQDSYSTT